MASRAHACNNKYWNSTLDYCMRCGVTGVQLAMGYRRNYNNNFYKIGARVEEVQKVTVSITWDLVTNMAYRVSFTNVRGNWNKCELVIGIIKQTIPSSQREYDPTIKTWFIGEAYIKGIVDICNAIPEFSVIYTEKPTEIRTVAMHTKEEDYTEFKRMLSFAHVQWEDTTDFKVARKAYHRAMMYLHPDKNPDMQAEATTLNVMWDRLKDTYFKEKELLNAV